MEHKLEIKGMKCGIVQKKLQKKIIWNIFLNEQIYIKYSTLAAKCIHKRTEECYICWNVF